MALNTAMRWRLVSVNAATLIDAPRTTSREIRPLAPDEAKALIVASREHPLEAFVTVALGCGLRLGEALGLQWMDVDLDAGTLQVRRAVQRFGGDRVARRPLRLAAGGRWHDAGFVFTSARGTPLEPRNVTRRFKALLKVTNLPDMRLDDLRHSCATLLLAQGVNPRVVMETLGHSQVSLTLNTYSHVLPALQQDAAARMDKILSH